MEKLIIEENDRYSLYCYPKHGIIHHVIHQFIYGDAFQNLLTKGAEAFENYKCDKWLSNDRSNTVLRKEDVEWGQKYWEPRVLKAGWKYWAIIIPQSAVGKLSMKSIIDRYASLGVNVEIFDDEQAGLNWLINQPG